MSGQYKAINNKNVQITVNEFFGMENIKVSIKIKGITKQ